MRGETNSSIELVKKSEPPEIIVFRRSCRIIGESTCWLESTLLTT
jgi:hypothetical protein